jgi:TolB-like protein
MAGLTIGTAKDAHSVASAIMGELNANQRALRERLELRWQPLSATAQPRKAPAQGWEKSLVAELKRRRVFRVLVGYGVFTFALLQIIEPIMHALHLPDEVLTYSVLALAIGFPISVLLAWAFDINAAIERTPAATGTSPRGAPLAFVLIAIGLLGSAPGLAWHFLRGRPAAASDAAAASIAVLAFSDLTEKHDHEYFADGVAEEILNVLAHVQGLKVVGRTSSFSFKGKNEDLRSIGQKLAVENVLEGSLRKDGDQLRITVQLIRVSDGVHLWSETYDRKLEGSFKLQDEIARTVVSAVRGALLAQGRP